MNKITIFGFPRSGTKLLADIYKQQGYHNFGEFFNCATTDIVHDTVPYAIRSVSKNNISTLLVEERIKLFNTYQDVTPSIVTLMPKLFSYKPYILNSLGDRYYLCTRRKNKFEQLISYFISNYNFNYDGLKVSKEVKIHPGFIERGFKELLTTYRIQQYLVSTGQGRYIDFDQLIAGKEDLGFEYEVTSKDEHTDLYSLVENLDEVKSQIKEIEKFTKELASFV